MHSGRKGGIYHKLQVELTYNSNHIEGIRLTVDQTRYIFETNTIGVLTDETVNVDDIIETSNHFRCIDLIIENRSKKLSEAFIKELHRVLKSGSSDSRKAWFAVGNYKKQPNEAGGEIMKLPVEVHAGMRRLLSDYGNGRVGGSSCSRSACGLALCRSAETGALDEPCRTYTPSGLIPSFSAIR